MKLTTALQIIKENFSSEDYEEFISNEFQEEIKKINENVNQAVLHLRQILFQIKQLERKVKKEFNKLDNLYGKADYEGKWEEIEQIEKSISFLEDELYPEVYKPESKIEDALSALTEQIDKFIDEAIDTSALNQLNPNLALKFRNKQELFTQLADELNDAPQGLKGKVLSSLVKNLGLEDDYEELQGMLLRRNDDEEQEDINNKQDGEEESPFAPASE